MCGRSRVSVCGNHQGPGSPLSLKKRGAGTEQQFPDPWGSDTHTSVCSCAEGVQTRQACSQWQAFPRGPRGPKAGALRRWAAWGRGTRSGTSCGPDAASGPSEQQQPASWRDGRPLTTKPGFHSLGHSGSQNHSFLGLENSSKPKDVDF